MIIQIIFLLALIIASIKSVIYLYKYQNLKKFGTKTEGNIIAIEGSNFISMKNAAVPKVNFITIDGKPVINKPIHSWFVEFNYYIPGKHCIAYYDKKQPSIFVIRSNGELIANFTMIVGTLCAITWFTLRQL